MRDSYMKTGQGFVLVYDITSATSFDLAAKLHTQILRLKEDTPDVRIDDVDSARFTSFTFLRLRKTIRPRRLTAARRWAFADSCYFGGK